MGRLTKTPQAKNAAIATAQFIPSDTTAARPNFKRPGTTRFNTDTLLLEFWDGSSWVQIGGNGLSTITSDTFAGDSVTTDFTMSIAVSNATDIFVFVSGVYQHPASAYTVNGTTTLSFSSPVPLAEPIIVLHGYNA